MKLKSLKVQGFKSFADSTTVEFHDGITAVVGPNGCGKSNISDAIRWVLGEQRPTAIRGAKMEEAIFQGTVNRRPVNRGSVSLVVSNEDGMLPVPFEEVEIGRQVFRDGGSEYSINRTTVRLRDVTDLYRDTGLGANAYAMIENRMIDAILSDRAEERRGLFEEASGIGKYKDRRKAAVRRLERAEMDLQRLEDVIAEVHTKVRSLARQKGKAQRYGEYRQRRLDVEVAVVRHQLETLRARLTTVEKDLVGDVQTGEGMVAEVTVAEAEFEALRLREVDAEKDRTAAAKALEGVRAQLVRWERDLAVADERAAYAARRLAQIDEERASARDQEGEFAKNEAELVQNRDALSEDLTRLKGVADERAEDGRKVRERLQVARSDLEIVEARGREIVRRGAQLEGDAEAADSQSVELERRLEQASEELTNTADALTDLESQGDLFSGRLDELSEALTKAESDLASCVTHVAEAREAFEVARSAGRTAADAAASLDARKAALEGLDRDREGVEPVIRAILEREDKGVLGVVSDFIDADAAATAAVEAYLGSFSTALVVRDGAALDRILDWFSTDWSGGGGLIVLPLDRVPSEGGSGSGGLLRSVEVHGDGAAWVRALLDGVELPDGNSPAVPVTERGGIVRVGNPAGGSGILERKEQLKGVIADHAEAHQELVRVTAQRDAAGEALREAEQALERARESRQVAEDEHRKVHGELSAQADNRGRMDRLQDELARQVEGTKAARTHAIERATEAREDREVLLQQESGLQGERDDARIAAERVQEEWETVRAEEARLAVDVARLEGDVTRLSDRLDTITAAREQARTRVEALDTEEAGLRTEQAAARDLRVEGDAATERLFGERTEAEASVQARDEALQTLSESLSRAERRAREARTAERAASDRRHALELEQQELTGRIARIRERLEGEWGRPLDVLLAEATAVDGEPETLQAELDELIVALE